MMFPKMTPVSVDETSQVSVSSSSQHRHNSPTLDRRLDVDEVVRTDILRRRPFDYLEIAQCRKFNCKVLQRLGRLVHKKHVEYNVKLMDLQVLAHAFALLATLCVTLT